jgi:hypothetical protein
MQSFETVHLRFSCLVAVTTALHALAVVTQHDFLAYDFVLPLVYLSIGSVAAVPTVMFLRPKPFWRRISEWLIGMTLVYIIVSLVFAVVALTEQEHPIKGPEFAFELLIGSGSWFYPSVMLMIGGPLAVLSRRFFSPTVIQVEDIFK